MLIKFMCIRHKTGHKGRGRGDFGIMIKKKGGSYVQYDYIGGNFRDGSCLDSCGGGYCPGTAGIYFGGLFEQ
jgi:hypothetical protein